MFKQTCDQKNSARKHRTTFINNKQLKRMKKKLRIRLPLAHISKNGSIRFKLSCGGPLLLEWAWTCSSWRAAQEPATWSRWSRSSSNSRELFTCRPQLPSFSQPSGSSKTITGPTMDKKTTIAAKRFKNALTLRYLGSSMVNGQCFKLWSYPAGPW